MRAIFISNCREDAEDRADRREIADKALSAEVQAPSEAHPSLRMPLIAIAVASVVAIALIVVAGAERAEQHQDFSHEIALGEITGPPLERDSHATGATHNTLSDGASPAEVVRPTASDAN